MYRKIQEEFNIDEIHIERSFIDSDMPDQAFYLVNSKVIIITDYYSDNEIERFFPMVINNHFNKKFIKYLLTKNGEKCFMSEQGWVFVAEVK